MIHDVYLPLLAAAGFGRFGVRLANRMRPSHATWFLTVGGAIVGTAALGSLLLLGFTLVGQVRDIAAIGDWSASALGRRSPVAAAVAATALAAVGLGAASAARVMIRRIRTIAIAHEACKRLTAVGGVVVTGDDDVAAYALPGRPGRVIVSAATLARLDSKEASALVAHEQSHLRHRHYLHQLTAAVVAATNPLLLRRLVSDCLPHRTVGGRGRRSKGRRSRNRGGGATARRRSESAAWRDPARGGNAPSTVADGASCRVGGHRLSDRGSALLGRGRHRRRPAVSAFRPHVELEPSPEPPHPCQAVDVRGGVFQVGRARVI